MRRLHLTPRAAYLACLPALALAAYLLRTGAPPSPTLAREPPRPRPATTTASEAIALPPPPVGAGHEVTAPIASSRPPARIAAAVMPEVPLPPTSRLSLELASESELRAMTWLLPEDVVLGLTKLSETSYSLEPSAVSFLFEHWTAVLSGMSLEWHSAANRPSIALLEIRPDSIADRLGFEAGDRVIGLDGVAPASERTVADTLQLAREHGRLEVEIERSGERWLFTLTTSAAGSPRTPRLQR